MSRSEVRPPGAGCSLVKPVAAAPAKLPVPRPTILYWRPVALAGVLALLLVGGVSVLGMTIPRTHTRTPAAIVVPAVRLETAIDYSSVVRPAEPAGPVTLPPGAAAAAEEPPGKARPANQTSSAVPVKPSAPAFKRRQLLDADELSKQLLWLPEIALESVAGSSKALLEQARTRQATVPHTPPLALLERSDLAGLPMRMDADCQLGKEAAENLQALSRKLRTHLGNAVPQDGASRLDSRIDAGELARLLGGSEGQYRDWLQPEAVPTLVQLLQVENKPVRLLLVWLLAQIRGQAATTALAQRALFDLSDEVREAAVGALGQRPRGDCRAVLLDGLRYPWPAVADHAAEALVALQDQEALPDLVRLLDEPSPALATDRLARGGSQMPVVREMVRVNHLSNCLLCHAPSLRQDELVRGRVPTPGQPVPPTFSTQYYQDRAALFVRADITYLRQDFSVPQPVANPEAWPVNQRYDYLVRLRPATYEEQVQAVRRRGLNYPQREAVLFALRELTGKDLGPASAAWQQLLAQAQVPGRMESGQTVVGSR
jgi:HEAT repeats